MLVPVERIAFRYNVRMAYTIHCCGLISAFEWFAFEPTLGDEGFILSAFFCSLCNEFLSRGTSSPLKTERAVSDAVFIEEKQQMWIDFSDRDNF